MGERRMNKRPSSALGKSINLIFSAVNAGEDICVGA
jgi:hypothetical protein